MGLFIRYLDRPNQIYRYLSDASYSLYLLHLPMVVWVGGLVAGTALPAGIKYLLTLVVSIPALLLIYHYAIRSSGFAAVLGVSNKNPEAALRLADRTYDSA
jgi:glucan biosynthesis protein C